MRLIITRHGETDYNEKGLMQPPDAPVLTTLGKEQTRALTKLLAGKGIDIIYCSTLQRAKETLEIIEEEIDASVIFEPLIVERDCGIWAGKSVKEFTEYRVAREETIHEFKPEGGESFVDVRKRAKVFWDKIRDEHADDTVLILTHGAFMRVLITLIRNWPLERAVDITQDNCCVNEFIVRGDKIKTIRINYTEHLGSLDRPVLTKD
ncbi:MAG: histidine phosphatase family protein [Candidatus Aenigmatarchaeota archaeon]